MLLLGAWGLTLQAAVVAFTDPTPVLPVALSTVAAASLFALARTSRDARQRRQQLHATLDDLVQEREATERLLRTLGEPVWVTDHDLRIQLANDAALRLVGVDEADVLQRPITDWVELPHSADRRSRRDGTLRSVRGPIAVQVSRAAAGTPAEPRWVFVLTDLSRRVEAEQRILEAARTALEANEAKTRFLASISHELRTPMNAILGYSEMLQEDETDEQKLADLTRIHEAGSHLLGLINEILDLSKVEAGEMTLELETFELDAVVDECLDTVRKVADAHDDELRYQPTGVLLRSDRRKVKQVLLNLLSNAAKFTRDGVIGVHVRSSRGEVIIDVHDTGRGIAADDLRHLFQPFRQVGDASAQPGTGLGLALCRSLVELLGGVIQVSSEPGVGSIFTVQLPGGGAREEDLPQAASSGGSRFSESQPSSMGPPG